MNQVNPLHSRCSNRLSAAIPKQSLTAVYLYHCQDQREEPLKTVIQEEGFRVFRDDQLR